MPCCQYLERWLYQEKQEEKQGEKQGEKQEELAVSFPDKIEVYLVFICLF
jgi:hypothetical protein